MNKDVAWYMHTIKNDVFYVLSIRMSVLVICECATMNASLAMAARTVNLQTEADRISNTLRSEYPTFWKAVQTNEKIGFSPLPAPSILSLRCCYAGTRGAIKGHKGAHPAGANRKNTVSKHRQRVEDDSL